MQKFCLNNTCSVSDWVNVAEPSFSSSGNVTTPFTTSLVVKCFLYHFYRHIFSGSSQQTGRVILVIIT